MLSNTTRHIVYAPNALCANWHRVVGTACQSEHTVDVAAIAATTPRRPGRVLVRVHRAAPGVVTDVAHHQGAPLERVPSAPLHICATLAPWVIKPRDAHPRSARVGGDHAQSRVAVTSRSRPQPTHRSTHHPQTCPGGILPPAVVAHSSHTGASSPSLTALSTRDVCLLGAFIGPGLSVHRFGRRATAAFGVSPSR